jgi:hypothetical protein
MAAGALAQEKSAPPPDISLEAAKRDFNAVKAARGSLDAPAKLELPSVATPEFSAGAPQPLPSPMKPDPALAKKKSANWLVDAMMKPEAMQARDPRDKNFGQVRSDRSDSAFPYRDGREAAPDSDLRPGAESETRTPVVSEKKTGPEFNPLTNYMAGWMTPQDYSLLKPGLESAVSSRMANSPIEQVALGGTNDLLAPGNVSAGGIDSGTAARPAAFAAPAPADNPFLQSLNAPPAPVASFTPPSAGAPTGTVPSALVPAPTEPQAAKSKIPDFAKPAADEKYFKQLKRF